MTDIIELSGVGTALAKTLKDHGVRTVEAVVAASLEDLKAIPGIGAAFGDQSTSRGETELIVLVSPELVHPLEPDEAPTLLPGMQVTDPTNHDFYGLQYIEGRPGVHHRSTVWPQYQQQMRAAKWQSQHQHSYYINGPHGFSQ